LVDYDFQSIFDSFCRCRFLGDWQGGGYDSGYAKGESKTEKCHVTSVRGEYDFICAADKRA
jgi:hypothetical protein